MARCRNCGSANVFYLGGFHCNACGTDSQSSMSESTVREIENAFRDKDYNSLRSLKRLYRNIEWTDNGEKTQVGSPNELIDKAKNEYFRSTFDYNPVRTSVLTYCSKVGAYYDSGLGHYLAALLGYGSGGEKYIMEELRKAVEDGISPEYVHYAKAVSAFSGSAMSLAYERGGREIVEFIIKLGGNVNYKRSVEYEESLLHRACKKSDSVMVEFLIKNGADVNIRNKLYETPLYCIIHYSQYPVSNGKKNIKESTIKCVELLVENGADLTAAKCKESTPEEIKKILLEKDPNLVIAKAGCYIATCVYGSYDCPQVWTLRRYRDSVLSKSWYGRAFIKLYYKVSPILVKWFGNSITFKAFLSLN